MLALALALALIATTAAPTQGDPAPVSATPLLVANADGSWTITREIAEAATPLPADLAGLLSEEPDFGPHTDDADRRADEAADREADEAFEEAVEAARRNVQPNR